MSELPDPVSQVLRDSVDEARVQRLWRGIEARRPGASRLAPRALRPRALGAGALALAVAAAAFLWLRTPSAEAPGPLMRADGSALDTVVGPASVALVDGSRLVLGEGARLEPLRNDGGALTLLLARGRIEIEVQPGGPRTWSVETGVATVEVVGTVFRVERGESWARIEVERGVVVVRGEQVVDRAARLTRGESLTVGERPLRAARAALADPSVSVPEPRVNRAEPERAAPERSIAERRAPERVSLAPERALPERPAGSLEDAEALMSRADAARSAGRPEEAADLLERAMMRPGDPAAGVAAFTLGRLSLDVLRDPARAARAFTRALSLTLPPRLREDAAGRLVDAYARAGDTEGARAAADAYLAAYPEGRHAERVRAHGAP